MADTVKVRVTVDPVTVTLNKLDYREQYLDDCDDNGEDALEETPDQYVIEAYQQQLEDGDKDLAEVFEQASVDVKAV